MDENRVAWIALNLVPAKPSDRRCLLEGVGGDPVAVFRCNPEDLLGLEGLGGTIPRKVLGADWMERALDECRRAEALGFHILTPADTIYPDALRVIPDPPPALYVLGDLLPTDDLAVAVVGSRRPTSYGREAARNLARGLAARGITVVSGMAIGLDAEAHRGALEAGGRTLAVLGSGLDRPYPAANRRLMEKIAARGAALSEFPLGTEPFPANFPQRNRVIAGLSAGTVVVEAKTLSGSMGTMRLALDFGRETFAVPGRIDSDRSEGTNRLIREGLARLVTSADDIVDELPAYLQGRLRSKPDELPFDAEAAGLAEEEIRVLTRLHPGEPVDIDRLARMAGLAPGALLDALLSLEMRKLIRSLPGARYLLAEAGKGS